MTITVNPARNEYTSTAGQTVFNYTFKIYSASDLRVYVTPTGQSANDATDITVDYVVDPVTIGDQNGGFITFNTPLSDGDRVTIVSNISTNRTTDYQNNGDFLASTVNNDFDRAVSLVKQIESIATRTIQFQESEQNVASLTLPEPSAGDLIVWNPGGTGFDNLLPTNIAGIQDAVDTAVAARDAAQTSETNAAASEAAAAASAASINLPAISIADADKLLKVNASGTGYDTITTLPTNFLEDIETLSSGVAYTYNASGSGGIYTLSTKTGQIGPSSYYDGLTARFFSPQKNSGVSSVNINGLGLKAIRRDGADLIGGEITGNTEIAYNATADYFEVMSPDLPKDFITGLKAEQSVGDPDHDIALLAGRARDFDDSTNIGISQTLTKQIDAPWAVGDNQGGLFTGAVAANTTYHMFLIKDPTTGIVDAGFDTSATAGSRPAAYTIFRRVFSFITDASSNIIPFNSVLTEGGSLDIDYNEQITDLSTTTPGAGPTDLKLTVPDGVIVKAHVGFVIYYSADSFAYICPTSVTPPTTLDVNTTMLRTTSGSALADMKTDINTDTSGQIRHKQTAATYATFRIMTHGYKDFRSR